jgi:hypothetical protein
MRRILHCTCLLLPLSCLTLASCSRTPGTASSAGAADAPNAVSLPAGHYVGSVTVNNLSACEEFAWNRINRPAGDSTTDAFLTVTPHGATLVLEEEQGNTKAADYFQTSDATLLLTPGRMLGGRRHVSTYYFDMSLRRDPQGGGYIAAGTWIIQDACEGQAPSYHATLKLKPDTA